MFRRIIKQSLEKIPIVKNIQLKKLQQQHLDLQRKKYIDQTPIFIYQMGKVASTSIYNSLQNQYEGEVIHSHSFRPFDPTPVDHLHEMRKMHNIPLKVITLVREPIGRNISAFFQNYKMFTGIDFERSKYSAEQNLHLFLENYWHGIPLYWLDRNIEKKFGIDVFNRPFDESGIAIYQKENVELLLLRHDLKDEEKENSIRQFTGAVDFKIKNENVSAQKNYSSMYKAVKELPLPEYYINFMLNSKYAKHFFKKDLDMIRNRWRG